MVSLGFHGKRVWSPAFRFQLRVSRLVDLEPVSACTASYRPINVSPQASAKVASSGQCFVSARRKVLLNSRSRGNGPNLGSLTIVATALVETGSKMDELIFQEFKGTGNSEIVLDRKVAELRLWPAINLSSSGTRKEEDLLPADILEKASFVRRAMAPMKIEDAAETLIERMAKTSTNKEFLELITTA